MKSVSSRSRARFRPERIEGRQRLAAQLVGKRARAAHAQNADVGWLVLGGILARRLAQRRGVRLHVQQIIHHLERQARRTWRSGPDVRRGRCPVRRRRRRRASTAARIKRAGLVDMHVLKLRQAELRAGAGQIDGLPTGHAARARCRGQYAHHLQLACGHGRQWPIAQHLECQALQAVAHQQRGGLVEGDMAGRFAAAQDVVVHAGKVVVHQGVGVNQLHCRGGDRGCLDGRLRSSPAAKASSGRTRLPPPSTA